MDGFGFESRTMQLDVKSERQIVEDFLRKNELILDKDVEYTTAIFQGEQIIATGSLEQNILKCIAVDSAYQGMSITNTIVTELVKEAYNHGHSHLFIYTKPKNLNIFKDLGFYKIAEAAGRVVLLENKPNGIDQYLKEIGKFKKEAAKVSAIVVNCNPFTLGHQYIIERAAAESDVLHIFVVWEDKSSFPSQVRYELVKKGTEHLKNVVIHKGKDYIISQATFPSYFIKEYNDVVETHAMLDLTIFGSMIAPALGIKRRYIGQEPYCKVTDAYNRVMKTLLPSFNIEVVELERVSDSIGAISASRVRELIRQNKLDEVSKLVPKTTFDYLVSSEAAEVINKIKAFDKRH